MSARIINVLESRQLNAVGSKTAEGAMATTLSAMIAWNDGVLRRSYLKIFEKPLRLGILNEVTGYLLAKAVNLPVASHAGLLMLPEEFQAGAPTVEPWAFVCAEVAGRTPTTIMGGGSVEDDFFLPLVRILAGWSRLPEALAFDDWTANTDRHLGNLVIGGPESIHLIDHSNLPVTINWNASDLNPQKEFTSCLIQILNLDTKGTLPKKMAIAEAAKRHPQAFESVAKELYFWWDIFLSDDEHRRQSLERFLIERASHGHRRLSSTLYLLAV